MLPCRNPVQRRVGAGRVVKGAGGSLAQLRAGGRRSPGAVWEMQAGVRRCVLHLLPGIVKISVCSSQCLMNSFMRLISYCSLFIMAITQMKSQDCVLSLNNGFILCQTALGVKTTFCCQCAHVCRTVFVPKACTDLLVIPWWLLGYVPGSLLENQEQDSLHEGRRGSWRWCQPAAHLGQGLYSSMSRKNFPPKWREPAALSSFAASVLNSHEKLSALFFLAVFARSVLGCCVGTQGEQAGRSSASTEAS